MLKQFFKTYYPAFIILIVLSSFSIFAYYQSAAAAGNRRTRLFELRVQQATDAVQKRLTDYVQILKGCQALFYATDNVSYHEWAAYTNNLQVERNYPGIQALAFARYIPETKVAELETEMHQIGFPDFRVRSDFRNSHLTPIIYIRPMSKMNLRAFGYDMYAEPNRREAMNRAILSGEASMTRAKITLVQEANQDVQPGFLLYLPVYRNPSAVRTTEDRKKQIQGFVYNAFRAHDLMRAILADFEDIEIDLYASPEINRKNLLYSSGHAAPESKEKEYSAESDLQIAGAIWKMAITSKDGFGSRIEKRQPFLILIFGLAISGLMFAIALSSLKRRSEMTEELNLTKALEMKKDEFIGIASHELKTPLTSIKAYIQLLEKSKLGERDRTFVEKANANVRKLNSLISDLLDVSKIQAGRLQFNFAAFSLREMVEESMENVQHMFSTHRIVAERPIPDVIVNGDKLRLEQALTNFLVNAVKYSPGADRVNVNTSVTDREVTIEVIDQGIGVADNYKDQIFERFYRVDSVSPIISGLGVGLYITHQIIRRHDGRVGLRKNAGKGSTFFFSIPLNRPATE